MLLLSSMLTADVSTKQGRSDSTDIARIVVDRWRILEISVH
jgi:hypothetical protein